MKTQKFLTAAMALSLSALGAIAQSNGSTQDGPPPGEGGQGAPPRHHRRMPPPMILALDANHDGVISADEIANATASLLTLDANKDGQLTKDEYTPQHPGGQDGPPPGGGQQGGQPQDRPARPVPPIDKALDLNADGTISADEIAKAPTSLLTLDKNGDGKLTMDELMPPRPEHGPGRGGPGDDGHMPPPEGGPGGGQNQPPQQDQKN
jgi:hypothetical protein